MANLEDIQTGTVVAVDDSNYNGRIKVRVPGVNDHIDTDNLPWCTYSGSAVFSGDGGGSISVPRVGAKVRVKFKGGDINSMEWVGANRIDDKLRSEISVDYEGSHTILYDSESDLSIMYQNKTGLRIYYKGSFIQLQPDNTITMHYGEGNQGVQIQLSDGKVDIQGTSQINISSGGSVKVEADNIVLNGKGNVQIKGDNPGECAVNGKVLFATLMGMANLIDQKLPATGGICMNVVQSARAALMNQGIQYI